MALRNTPTWNILAELFDLQPVIIFRASVSLCEKLGQFYWRFLNAQKCPTGSGSRLLCCLVDNGNAFLRSKTAVIGAWYLILLPGQEFLKLYRHCSLCLHDMQRSTRILTCIILCYDADQLIQSHMTRMCCVGLKI